MKFNILHNKTFNQFYFVNFISKYIQFNFQIDITLTVKQQTLKVDFYRLEGELFLEI
jgi:hypothetical protein